MMRTFDRLMSGVCSAVFCGLWGKMKGEAETGTGQDERVAWILLFQPCWIAKGGHLSVQGSAGLGVWLFCCMWHHHSAWGPLSEILKK